MNVKLLLNALDGISELLGWPYAKDVHPYRKEDYHHQAHAS